MKPGKPPKEKFVTIRLEGGAEARARAGCTVLEALWAADARTAAPCGGNGKCGKCRVEARGRLSAPTAVEKDLLSAEELRQGVRLACRARAEGDVVIKQLAAKGGYAAGGWTNTGGRPGKRKPAPRTKKIEISITVPTLKDQRALAERVSAALGGAELPIETIKNIPAALRGGRRVDATVCGGAVVDIRPRSGFRPLGAAVDIGTTTLSARLCDLESGATLGECRALNPQTKYGGDVAARISFAMERADGPAALRRAAVDKLNEMIAGLAADAGAVCDVALAGNPTMIHIFFGVDPAGLAAAPFAPVFSDGIETSAREAGLTAVHPNARLRALPGVSAYVGADTVGAALAAGLTRPGPTCLLVDIGTNAEIFLRTPKGLSACSAAAGPAFEGAGLECGTWARPGALQHIALAPELSTATIGGGAPDGICGSAVFDLVAELRKTGALEAGGRIAPENLRPEFGSLRRMFTRAGGQPRFVIAAKGRGTYFSQRDVRQVQLAKSAIRTGIEILLRRMGVKPGELKSIIVAGLLGNSLRAENVIASGLFPEAPAARIKYAGNAAIEGAAMTLLDERRWNEARRLARETRYVELSGDREFEERFTGFLGFP